MHRPKARPLVNQSRMRLRRVKKGTDRQAANINEDQARSGFLLRASGLSHAGGHRHDHVEISSFGFDGPQVESRRAVALLDNVTWKERLDLVQRLIVVLVLAVEEFGDDAALTHLDPFGAVLRTGTVARPGQERGSSD